MAEFQVTVFLKPIGYLVDDVETAEEAEEKVRGWFLGNPSNGITEEHIMRVRVDRPMSRRRS